MSPPYFSGPSPVDGYYDVFISFGGNDEKLIGFTDNLCNSLRRNRIHTFMMHEEVKMEEESINYDVNFRVIERSRIAVVICSTEYAKSERCLKELEMIMQRWEDNKIRKMIPIFYQVHSGELRKLTGQTGKYLDQHIAEHGETTVQKWKAAVSKLGGITGHPYKHSHDRYESHFLDNYIVPIIKDELPASYEYDVFLSFRGKDTRESFASTLRYILSKVHKVETFMDISFEKGNNLKELLKMVERSKFSIVIFSENFAESEWCLKELAKIFEERDSSGHQVVPVFYKVDISELRDQHKGKTREHMDKHYNKYGKDSDLVKSWSNAINELGNLSGHTYRSDRGKFEVDLATEIAQDIRTRLRGRKAVKQGSSSKLSDIFSMDTNEEDQVWEEEEPRFE